MNKIHYLNKVAKRYNANRDFDKYLIKFGANHILNGIRKGSVLEIGCSNGIMTDILVRNFKKVVVVDAAKLYLQKISDKHGNKVKCLYSLLENFKNKDKFDNIIAARLLEHLDNPVEQLKRIKSWLKSKGFLHIIVPNANSLNRLVGLKLGILKKTTQLTARDVRFGHKRVYDKKLLLKHIHKAGLKIVKFEGIYLKPLSNAQMIKFTPKLIRAFYEISKIMPVELCSELYVRCKVR